MCSVLDNEPLAKTTHWSYSISLNMVDGKVRRNGQFNGFYRHVTVKISQNG